MVDLVASALAKTALAFFRRSFEMALNCCSLVLHQCGRRHTPIQLVDQCHSRLGLIALSVFATD
jgi:hypothetical protein